MHRLYGLVPTVLMLVALLAAAPAIAEEAGEQYNVLTPAHVAQIRTVDDVFVAPDGSSVAYSLNVPRRLFEESDGSSWRELHWFDAEGVHRPLITGQVKVSSVAWAPDARSLTFLDQRGDDEHNCLYRLPLGDGAGEAQRLLCHSSSIGEYDLHPDGRIAFVATEAKTPQQKRLEKAGFTQEVFEEDARFDHLWVATPRPVSPDGGDGYAVRRIDVPAGHVSDIAWSPVDNRLVLALAPTPLVDDELMQRRVHVIDSDSGEVLVRVANPGKLKHVSFAPDGRHVAMISAVDISDPRESRLMVAAVGAAAGQTGTDGVLLDVTPKVETKVTDYAWTGGDSLVLLGDEGVHTRVYRVAVDGSRHQQLSGGRASWSDIAASADGRLIGLVGDTPTHPAELFTLSGSGGEAAPERLTESNPWLADQRLAPQEIVTWTARDGLQLEGVLVRPLNEIPGQRYPVIMTIHGGPEAHIRDGWLTTYSRLGQVAAARGFAVFHPNYRGSTGRGVEFHKLGHKDFAGKEFDDIVDAIDHLVDIGLADANRIGITGGSYGGYASAWGATYYSERFAASVMMVGISDLVSALGTTDIPNEDQLVHKIVWPWQDWDLYRERSPLTYVEKARTPILILGGTSDPRVNPTQSQELYRYLELIGQTPVRYVRYSGEPHGNRRAASRFDYNLRALRWFEHYLLGAGLEAHQRGDDLRSRDLPPYGLDYEAALGR